MIIPYSVLLSLFFAFADILYMPSAWRSNTSGVRDWKILDKNEKRLATAERNEKVRRKKNRERQRDRNYPLNQLSLERSIFATRVLKVSSYSARQIWLGSWFHCIKVLWKKERRVVVVDGLYKEKMRTLSFRDLEHSQGPSGDVKNLGLRPRFSTPPSGPCEY